MTAFGAARLERLLGCSAFNPWFSGVSPLAAGRRRIPITQLVHDAARAVPPAMTLEDLADHPAPVPTLRESRAGWRRLPPGLKAAAANFEETTGFLRRMPPSPDQRFERCVHFGYSLRPKIANAFFFKRSRSRSTRRSSLSNSRMRASSEVATGPLGCSWRLFQRYNTFGPDKPSRSAIEWAECPSSNICTASCLNSSVNDRRFFTGSDNFFPDRSILLGLRPS